MGGIHSSSASDRVDTVGPVGTAGPVDTAGLVGTAGTEGVLGVLEGCLDLGSGESFQFIIIG